MSSFLSQHVTLIPTAIQVNPTSFKPLSQLPHHLKQNQLALTINTPTLCIFLHTFHHQKNKQNYPFKKTQTKNPSFLDFASLIPINSGHEFPKSERDFDVFGAIFCCFDEPRWSRWWESFNGGFCRF